MPAMGLTTSVRFLFALTYPDAMSELISEIARRGQSYTGQENSSKKVIRGLAYALLLGKHDHNHSFRKQDR